MIFAIICYSISTLIYIIGGFYFRRVLKKQAAEIKMFNDLHATMSIAHDNGLLLRVHVSDGRFRHWVSKDYKVEFVDPQSLMAINTPRSMN